MTRFPSTRLRRLRQTPQLRQLVQEARLTAAQLVLPLFVKAGIARPQPIPSMPGVARQSLQSVVAVARRAETLGIGAILLFGLPRRKDAQGSQADAEGGVIQQALRRIKRAVPGIVVITDVCLCEYTDHGHCGIVRGGHVMNDATLERLAAIAVSHAKAGADIVAPSAMMDGQVRSIRRALDLAGFEKTPVMAYAAKFASAFYGPFREAAASVPQFGDRQSYQMPPANLEEALREVALDIEEGADIIMVKPACAYLDVVRAVKERFHWPTAVYQVSGEYAMMKAAAQRGWLDEPRAVRETLVAMRRSGANLVITYYAIDAAKQLQASGNGG